MGTAGTCPTSRPTAATVNLGGLRAFLVRLVRVDDAMGFSNRIRGGHFSRINCEVGGTRLLEAPFGPPRRFADGDARSIPEGN
jgi:hypothetical protein